MTKRKYFLPENYQDMVLFIIMVFGIPLFALWLLTVIIPHYHASIDKIVIMHVCFILFVLFNIFGNLLYIINTDATIRAAALPSVLLLGWRYCYICQRNVPPRSFHCSICNICILKRDHHCGFTGCCIGHYNQRYFIMTVLYIWVGALYALCYEWPYVNEVVQLPALFVPITFLAPHFAYFLGVTSALGMIIIMLHCICIATFGVATYVMIMQTLSLITGQTQYERKHNIFDYSSTFFYNVRDIFGINWQIVWLSPTIMSKLKGDGIRFSLSEGLKNV